MKKLLFTLIVGLSFIGFGISTASASTFQDGMILASSKCGAGKCGSDKKTKCGEGKCGGDKKAAKCGEGKCGGDKKAAKCGEGKCGGDKPKKPSKGACGTGKCG